ncbi:MAG TPA: class I tRNA ligase family protein, partial [Kofleriaceae bacterium]|nr:class I tRNA ligase family protein [Kofleriaceae bacterium]
GKTRFVPELWTKTYMHWMTNIKDWTISRQLWWGHRIPAWFCGSCGQVTVSRTDPTECKACGSGELRQDEDVLDTWFSSALWPFSTLGWPDAELQRRSGIRTFYPNSVLVTAADIIFFWVARMMMMGLHFMGNVPFRVVYFTPIVTDEKGEKMSKVKGNVIDPLDVVHGATLEALLDRGKAEALPPEGLERIKRTYPKGIAPAGADALRFSLAAMTLPGRNIRLSMERIEGYRHFVNKLWNASRFALMNLDGFSAERFVDMVAEGPPGDQLTLADRWILSRLQGVCRDVDQALESFRFADAANALYHFVWGELCDWYIELAKPYLTAPAGGGEDEAAARRRFLTQGVLASVLETTLRMLHPIMPFVTEEIWHKLPRPQSLPDSLMITVYPRDDRRFADPAAEAEMGLVQEVAVAIRSLRSTYNVPPSWSVPVEVRAADGARREVLARTLSLIENAARVTVKLMETGPHIPQSAKQVVGADVEVVVPLAGLVDIDAEKKRIEKEIGKVDKEIAGEERRLGNPDFVARAPAEVVDEVRARLEETRARRRRLAAAGEALQ